MTESTNFKMTLLC